MILSLRRFLVACGLFSLLAGDLTIGAEPSAQSAIAALNKEFEQAHLKGDAATLANQYTKDAQAFWGPDGVVTGRKAIEKLWKSEIGSGGRKAELETLEVRETGDWAYETGRFKAYGPDGKLINDSYYIVIWKKEDGAWKLHRDLGGENRIAKKP